MAISWLPPHLVTLKDLTCVEKCKCKLGFNADTNVCHKRGPCACASQACQPETPYPSNALQLWGEG